MSSANKLCRIRIVTDCTESGREDINEESLIRVIDLKTIYYDLKSSSKTIVEDKRLTAVNENRLLSILILDQKLDWRKIISWKETIVF